jgi:hypothetical protein
MNKDKVACVVGTSMLIIAAIMLGQTPYGEQFLKSISVFGLGWIPTTLLVIFVSVFLVVTFSKIFPKGDNIN